MQFDLFTDCSFGDTKNIVGEFPVDDFDIGTCTDLVNSRGVVELCLGDERYNRSEVIKKYGDVNSYRYNTCCETCERLKNSSNPSKILRIQHLKYLDIWRVQMQKPIYPSIESQSERNIYAPELLCNCV